MGVSIKAGGCWVYARLAPSMPDNLSMIHDAYCPPRLGLPARATSTRMGAR